MKNVALIVLGSVAVLFVVASLMFKAESGPGQLDDFATCLAEEGAIFYGAFWCPNCQNQKKKFGNSEKLLPYVECSTPDGNGQLDACKEANVESYPTWEFGDGSRETGDLNLEVLAEKSGCELPQ